MNHQHVHNGFCDNPHEAHRMDNEYPTMGDK
jgi:hypothetical protein